MSRSPAPRWGIASCGLCVALLATMFMGGSNDTARHPLTPLPRAVAPPLVEQRADITPVEPHPVRDVVHAAEPLVPAQSVPSMGVIAPPQPAPAPAPRHLRVEVRNPQGQPVYAAEHPYSCSALPPALLPQSGTVTAAC